ncbi:carbohydrate ABC transporter permease [Plantactinospora sp. GCM10030261]|uniref:carbohydrate ABC transporter permease n=1 Tax=Plantactinospora sp. GCM10030261 TaxID=3273420 RepID=UPI003612FADF
MATETTGRATDGGPRTTRAGADRRRRRRVPAAFYWMAVPAFVLFFVFHTIPVLRGVFYSFTNYAGYGDWKFVGLSNYVNVFRDDRVIQSYLFTFQFAVVSTVAVNVIALAIAMGLNARIAFRNTLRGVFFLPNVLAILVVGYIFNYLFSNTLPYLGEKLGSTTLASSLLANEDLAWVAIVVFAVWQATAFAVILYLAGLQTIPADLYEAASIDGAGAWRRFRSITFPMIASFFTINMVLSLKNFLNVFDHIIPMTNGGPGTATESISLVIFRGGFQGGEFAYQTANAVLFFIVIVAFSFFQLRILQRREVSA